MLKWVSRRYLDGKNWESKSVRVRDRVIGYDYRVRLRVQI